MWTQLGSAVSTYKTWDVTKEDGNHDNEGEAQAAVTESGMPEIPDTTVHQGSLPLPPTLQPEAGGEVVCMPGPHWTHQEHDSEIQHQTPPENTRMPPPHKDRPSLFHASTDNPQQESIRQTRLDHLWRRHNSPPGQVSKVVVEETVDFYTVFPGGQWVVFILEGGRFCLRELCGPDRVPRSITVKLGVPVGAVTYNLWASEATDGSAILALSRSATSYS